jgi:hypothetical protein
LIEVMRAIFHNRLHTALVFLSAVTLVSQENRAQESSSSTQREIAVVPGRPSVTDPAAISAVGVLETELGLANMHIRSDESNITSPVVLKFSVSDRIQLRASSDGLEKRISGPSASRLDFTNLSLGVQYLLLSRDRMDADAALRVESIVLNEDNNFLTSNFRFVGLFGKDFGDPHLDFNLAYTYLGYELPSRRSQWQISAALDGAILGQWRWAGELREIRSNDFKPVYGLAAVTYQPCRSISWDFGMEFGLNNDAPRYTLFAGVVFILLR